MDNEITTKLLSFSIIFFLTEKVNILCSDMFKWSSVLHSHGSNTSHLKGTRRQAFPRPFRRGGICPSHLGGDKCRGQSNDGGTLEGDIDLIGGDLTLIDYIIN